MTGLRVLGWREHVGLPHLGIPDIKAKVDTGARTSSLQAFDPEPYMDVDRERIRFLVRPAQGDDSALVPCDLPVHDWRWIKDSGGHATFRPIILTPVRVGSIEFTAELSLASRADMGFRMLLGREALRGRFVVDASQSYVATAGVDVEAVALSD
ncbi:MAG: ATP-dependent zinc protease [Thermoplasmatota archaeon]